MKTYEVTFEGRLKGAIGTFQKYTRIVTAHNQDLARLALYKEFYSVHHPKFEDVELRNFNRQVKFAKAYMHDVSIICDASTLQSVVIADDTGFHDDICFSDHDSENFKKEVGKLAEQYPDTCLEDIYLLLAMPYAESIWN